MTFLSARSQTLLSSGARGWRRNRVNHIPSLKKLENALSDMVRYLELNADSMPNYGKRYRAGQRISTGFVESAVNEIVAKRMVKKQPMRWNRTLSRVSSMFAFTC